MKKLFVILISMLLLLALSACGEEYTCISCGETTRKAYYDLGGMPMCEACAQQYWLPLDYEDYRIN